MSLRTLKMLLAIVMLAAVSYQRSTLGVTAEWNSGDGEWNQAPSWKGQLPGRKTDVEIHGLSKVLLSNQPAVAGSLDVGRNKGDNPELVIDGGTLNVTTFLRIGEYTGSNGLLHLKSGDVHVGNDIGSANYYKPDINCSRGTLRVSGGSLSCRDLILGTGQGSQALLEVVGSKSTGIDILDFLSLGTAPFKLEQPSTSTLSFTLDENGVTPILIHFKGGGLQLYAGGDANKRHLQISLIDRPPGGDILLVRTACPIRGVFTDLPEGSPIRASFAGKTWQWTLTYRGGPEQHDLMLTSPHEVMSDGKLLAVSLPPVRSQVAASLGRLRPVDLLPTDNPPPGKVPAFPGAEGYGAYAKGGRGGKVIFVTNLHDSGKGSLREAVESQGPRTILFTTGGIIQLKSTLIIREPYVTIAGQSAPGDGICIRGAEVVLQDTHDVVLRYLRLRPGRIAGKNIDCIRAHGSDNFILDHLSLSWSTDKNIVPTSFSDNYTVQWCIISESIDHEHHAFAMIVGGEHSTWHHNLLAHHTSRTPRLSMLGRCDWRNNVIYDWGHTSAYGEFTWLNYVGNYFKPGPSTTQKPPLMYKGDCTVSPGSMFAEGNVMEGFAAATADNWKAITFDPLVRAGRAQPCPPVSTQSAADAYAAVLDFAGAILPTRDAIDRRVVSETRGGAGRIIAQNESEVGGYPNYAGGHPPIDSDSDGIPDEWERAHGMNPQDPADAGAINGQDGYTNLERYLNSIKPIRADSGPNSASR